LNEGKPGSLRAPGLTIEDLQVRYSNGAGAVTALEIEQLNVPGGTQLAVTGPSGSG
jgi:ABC-type lipoprotein export system ATPase subunit